VPTLHHAPTILSRLFAGAALLIAMACGGGGGKSSPPVGPSGSWGSAQILENNLLSDSGYPQVAVDASGRALVVWFRLSGPSGPADIWAKVYQPGTGWQPEGTIESMDGDARYPVVAVGGDGAFSVSWQHTPTGGSGPTGIWVNRYVPGTGWSGPLQISTGTTSSSAPAIAADGAGNAIVAWHQINASGNYEVRASRYAAASSWSAPIVLATGASADNFNPLVAMDPDGNGMVAWNRAADVTVTTGPWTVCAWPYRAGIGWGQIPATVPSLQAGVEGVQDAYGSAVAMSSAGAVLGWTELYNGSNYRPFARIWNPTTGVWSAAASVTGTLDAVPPEVGIDATGKVHAAWFHYTASTWNDLYVASYSPTSGVFTVPTQPVDTLTGNIGSFALHVNAAGSAALVWNQMNGSLWNIYASRFESASGWNTPSLLETNDAGSAYVPTVRLNASGQAFATWYQLDANSMRHIYANRWN